VLFTIIIAIFPLIYNVENKLSDLNLDSELV